MKKIILSSVFTFIFINANAQDILDKVTKEVCSCTAGKVESMKTSTPDAIKMQLGLCILSSYTNHKPEIVAKYGEVMEKDGAMEKLGEDIGMKMVTICPDVLMSIASTGGFADDDSSKVAESKTIEGEISDIKIDQFVTIQIKDKNGRAYSFLFLNYFETASLFTNNEIKKKDKITVTYTETELYDTKEKEFRYFKIITQLDKK
jgi:hypothetical protein